MATLNAEVRLHLKDSTRAGANAARNNIARVDGALGRLQRTAQTLIAGGLIFSRLTQGVSFALRAFSDMEKGLIAVAKTADLSANEMQRLGDNIAGLAESVATSQNELLDIATAAGQLGIKGVDNLTLFTETVAKLGLATNLSGEEAALALARMLTVTGEGPGVVDRLGAAITALGNNFAASEREIALVATRVAAGTALFGVSAAEASAFGAALKSLGIDAELGSTAVSRAFVVINQSLSAGGREAQVLSALIGKSIEELREQFSEDSVGVFEGFIQGLGRVDANKAITVLEELGLEGTRLIQVLGTLSKRPKELARALDIANKEFEQNTALSEEAAKALEGFSKKMDNVRGEITNTATEIGSFLAPAVLTMAENWRYAGVVLSGITALFAGRFLGAMGRLTQATHANSAATALQGEVAVIAARHTLIKSNADVAAARINLQSVSTTRAARIATLQLAAAERAATTATTAHAAALLRTQVAASAMGRGVAIARTLLVGLGGPLNVVLTLLALGATAWALFGSAAKGAAQDSEAAVRAQIDALEKAGTTQIEQIDKLILARRKSRADAQARLQEANKSRAIFVGSDVALNAQLQAQRAARKANADLDQANKDLATLFRARARIIKQDRSVLDADDPALNALLDALLEGSDETEVSGGGRLSKALEADLQFRANALMRALDNELITRQQHTAALVALTEVEFDERIAAAQVGNEAELAQRELAADTITALETRRADAIADIKHRANQRALEADESFQKESITALERYAANALNETEGIERALVGAFRGAEDALTKFVRTGKLNFSDLANSIIDDLIRIAIRASITGPLAGAVGNLFSGSGGHNITPGRDGLGPPRALGGPVRRGQAYLVGEHGPELFSPGISGNIIPNSALRPAGRSASGAQNISVRIVNQGQPKNATAQVQPDFDGEGAVVRIVLDDLAANGRIAQGLQQRFALSGRVA